MYVDFYGDLDVRFDEWIYVLYPCCVVKVWIWKRGWLIEFYFRKIKFEFIWYVEINL